MGEDRRRTPPPPDIQINWTASAIKARAVDGAGKLWAVVQPSSGYATDFEVVTYDGNGRVYDLRGCVDVPSGIGVASGIIAGLRINNTG